MTESDTVQPPPYPPEPDGGFRRTEKITIRLTPDEKWYLRVMALIQQRQTHQVVTESDVVQSCIRTVRMLGAMPEANRIHKEAVRRASNGGH